MDALKQAAALEALKLVQNGMTVGLGTGSTAAHLITGLGRLMRKGELTGITAVPTSEATARLAREHGIELVELDSGGVDLAIDGCDEFDPALWAIKGLGGALTREKLVAENSSRFVLIADDSKAVSRLGSKAPVPVEVVPFGWQATAGRVTALGGTCELRPGPDGQPLVTDNGNLVLDYHPDGPFDPLELAETLKGLTGVVEHGLFLGQASLAIVAGAGGVRSIEPS